MRFVCDQTWRWVGERALLAGSPPRLFRLTDAGAEIAHALHGGADIEPSTLVDRLLDAGAIHPALPDDDAYQHSRGDVTVVTPQLGGNVVEDGRVTVDDASEPPLVGAAVRLEVNVGPGGARNAGRRAVSTPLICFVDADVEVAELNPTHPDHDRWWRTVLAHFDDPRVALVAPRVIGDNGSSLDLGATAARIRAGTRVSYAPGAALVVRTAAFDAVGGFDETLRVGEDVDFVWRLDQAGWRCRYEPAATVHHRPRATFVEQLRQQVKYGSSSGPLALRHPHALAPWRAGALMAAMWALAALGRPALAAVAGVGSVGQFMRRANDLPPAAAARVAVDGHVAAARQLPVALRRAWWPLLVPLLWSRRARRIALCALVGNPTRVAKDIAFSVGVWRSSIRCREHRAILPMVNVSTSRR